MRSKFFSFSSVDVFFGGGGGYGVYNDTRFKQLSFLLCCFLFGGDGLWGIFVSSYPTQPSYPIACTVTCAACMLVMMMPPGCALEFHFRACTRGIHERKSALRRRNCQGAAVCGCLQQDGRACTLRNYLCLETRAVSQVALVCTVRCCVSGTDGTVGACAALACCFYVT